jgi:ADP-ribose pyrophosphatase YjhB (NUDIX family)
MKAKEILISGALVFKKDGNKSLWFLVKQGDRDSWEIPKTTVRRGESSVRAVIRMTGEQGGMRARVLEEVGRSSGSTLVNGKVVPQKHLFYLMIQSGESEILGFTDATWLEYKKALAQLESKKEQKMLTTAFEMSKDIQKERLRDPEELEDELGLEEQI